MACTGDDLESGVISYTSFAAARGRWKAHSGQSTWSVAVARVTSMEWERAAVGSWRALKICTSEAELQLQSTYLRPCCIKSNHNYILRTARYSNKKDADATIENDALPATVRVPPWYSLCHSIQSYKRRLIQFSLFYSTKSKVWSRAEKEVSSETLLVVFPTTCK